MRRKSERGDERKRGVPYCPLWLGPSIDQRREGEAGWEGERKNRPRGLGPNSLVACALFLSYKLARAVGGHIKGSYPSIRPICIHTNAHINASTRIPAFEKRSIWWHHFPFCSAVRHRKSKLICYRRGVKESHGLLISHEVLFWWRAVLVAGSYLDLCAAVLHMKTSYRIPSLFS